MAIITLTSDYGYTDPYLAAVKGRLVQETPEAPLVDISHGIKPGNLWEAAFVIRNAYHHFPGGTIHLILVDELPQSGRWLMASLDDHYFICADNGLLSMVNPGRKMEEAYWIELPDEQGGTFPGKGFLAAAAAHLARGGKGSVIGRKADEINQSLFLRPRISKEDATILGTVVYVDNFGNLITNISRKIFDENRGDRSFEINIHRHPAPVKKLVQRYDDVSAGAVAALFNSMDLLEIALTGTRGQEYNGANTLLGVEVHDPITVQFK